MAQKEGIRHKKPLEYSAAAARSRLFTNSASLFMAASPILGKLLQQQPSKLCQRDDDLALRTTRYAMRLRVERVKMKAYPEKEAKLR